MSEAKKRILLVDDDRSILRVFTRVLERSGYAVTAVETGKACLAKIKSASFDAAFVDVRLPDVDGTQLLPIIQEFSPKTVRIVFTGSPDLDSAGDGYHKYIDALLIKPVKPEVVLDLLSQKLRSHD